MGGARSNNLPAQPTPLIGREKELGEASSLLRQTQIRLVTFTGPGGTGKTRLALQVGADMVDEFEDGVIFVNLAPIADPSLVASTIATVLDVKEAADKPLVESLKDYLREKAMLLLLDNFEQVLEAAPTIAELMGAAPRLKVLVTSRAALHLRGEHEFPVPPLSLPPVGAGRTQPMSIKILTQYEAVHLFIERAVGVKPDFEVNNENAPAVAEICSRLDGLPLAIELAAARIRLLPPQAMLARLESRLKLLTGGARDLPTRQQTLRGAIEWSYGLLSEDEKKLFRRLTVFVGGRTLEAIEAVCNADGDLGIDVLDGVQFLVDKSLLRQEEGVGGEPRFVMLETIHEFAREKLEENGESTGIQKLHACYFMELVRHANPLLKGPEQFTWLNRLEEEHDNFRAALRAMLSSGEAEIALVISGQLGWQFWWQRPHRREGAAWLKEAMSLAHAVDPSGEKLPADILAYAYNSIGNLAKTNEEALEAHQAGLLYALRAGDKLEIAGIMSNVAQGLMYQGAYASARVTAEESLAIRRELGVTRGIALSLAILADIEALQGNYKEAEDLFEETIGLFNSIGDWTGRYWMTSRLADLAFLQSDYTRAEALLREYLPYTQDAGDQVSAANGLHKLAAVYGAQGKSRRAATLIGAANVHLEATGDSMNSEAREEFEQDLKRIRTQQSLAEFERCWEEGQAMTLEEAIIYALKDPTSD